MVGCRSNTTRIQFLNETPVVQRVELKNGHILRSNTLYYYIIIPVFTYDPSTDNNKQGQEGRKGNGSLTRLHGA